MVMLLRKKVWRTMMDHKSQYLGSVALIIISCMMFSTFVVAGMNAQDNLHNFRELHNVEDAHFVVQSPLENIESLENQYKVELEQRQYADVSYSQDSVLRLMTAPDTVNQHVIIEGDSLTNRRDVLLGPGFAKAHHLSIGDTIQVFDKTFLIRGLMVIPDYIYPLKSETDVLKNDEAFGVALISQNDMNELESTSSIYTIRLNGQSADDFIAAVHTTNTIVQWVNKAQNNRISFVDGDIEGGMLLGAILPTALLVLTLGLVSILMWRLLKQEYREIGTLYALGFRKREIMRQYLLYPLFIAVLGGSIGTLIGILFIRPLVNAYAGYYNFPVLHINLHWGFLLLCFILPFLFLVPVTAWVVHRVLRLSPLQLMRGFVGSAKIGWLERNIKLDWFSFQMKFRIREMVRNVPRMLFMLMGVIFASMLFLLGFVTQDSMDELVNGSYQDAYQYEYQYTFKLIQTGTPPLATDRMSLASFTSPMYQDGNQSFIIYGVDSDTELLRLNDSSGNPLTFDQVIITKPLAEKMGVAVGDEIHIHNEWNAQSSQIQVDQIADTFIGEYIYLPLTDFNTQNGYPVDNYVQLISDERLDIDGDQLLSELSKQDLLDGYQNLIKPLQSMVAVIAVIAFLIGLIIIHIVFTMTIEENRDKISLFKILGYKRKEVFSLVLGMNKWLVLIGYLLSIPLIVISLELVFNAVTAEMGITFPITIRWVNLFIVFLLLCFVYLISKWLNRAKIHRIPMEEMLKSARE
jgi:putative ABC transport system permease protein